MNRDGAMRSLNFPEYAFDIRTDDGKAVIFDPFRRKYVRLTPEEWVRQHLICHLVQDLGFPKGRTAVETGFTYQGLPYRADVIVYNRQGVPLLMAECKSPDVRINQRTFDQVAWYNREVQAEYLLVTNGLDHYCFAIDRERKTYRFLEKLPRYEEL